MKSSLVFQMRLIVCFLAICTTGAQAHMVAGSYGVSVCPDPGLKNPTIIFGNGDLKSPAFFPVPPTISPAPSGLYISQWDYQSVPLDYTMLTVGNNNFADPFLGPPTLRFVNPLGDRAVEEWETKEGVILSLQEAGGALVPGGGADMYLACDEVSEFAFDKSIDLDFNMRVGTAEVTYNPGAQKDSVLIHSRSSFVAQYFPTGVNRPTAQIIALMPHNDPRCGAEFPCDIKQGTPHRYLRASTGANGEIKAVFDMPDIDEAPAPFAEQQQFKHYHYHLQDVLCAAIEASYPDMGNVFQDPEYLNLANWRLAPKGSVSFGMEGGDYNVALGETAPMGSDILQMLIADWTVMQHTEEITSCSGYSSSMSVPSELTE